MGAAELASRRRDARAAYAGLLQQFDSSLLGDVLDNAGARLDTTLIDPATVADD